MAPIRSIPPVLLLATVAFASEAPLEELLSEGWRWRTLEDPVPDAAIGFVQALDDGGLVVADREGLERFDGLTWSPLATGVGIAPDLILRVVPLPDDALLVAAAGRVVRIDPSGDVEPLLTEPDRTRVGGVCTTADGGLLTAQRDVIYTYADGGMKALFDGPPGDRAALTLVEDAQGRLIASGVSGVFVREDGAWRSIAPPQPELFAYHLFRAGPLVYMLPTAIDGTKRGLVWDGARIAEIGPPESSPGGVALAAAAGTSCGSLVAALRDQRLWVLRDRVWRRVTLPHPLDEPIISVASVPGGRLAVVGRSRRLSICDLEARRWVRRDPSPHGLSDYVNALSPSARGGVWIGTHSGVARWDGEAFRDVRTEAVLADGATVPLQSITTVHEDARGRVWIGSGSTFGGALVLDVDDGSWTRHAEPEGIGDRHVHAIRAGADGALWFLLLGPVPEAPEDGGVARLADGAWTRFTTEDGLPHDRAYDLATAPDGTVYAATLRDVAEFDGAGWRALGAPMSTGQRPFALGFDADGALWVGRGVDGLGLLRRRGGAWEEMTGGAWDGAGAASFHLDDDGRLWFASLFGLFFVEGDECHEISQEGYVRLGSFWPIAPADGGGLWLGSHGEGLVRYRPDDDEPPVAFDVDVRWSTAADGDVATWSAADPWRVTPSDRLRYRVCVDGVSCARPLRVPRVKLGDLEAGKHLVTVAAIDLAGNEQAKPAEDEFVVARAFWERPEVYALAAGVVVAAAWIVLLLRARARERAQAHARLADSEKELRRLTARLLDAQEDERRTIARDLHDDLGQALTAATLELRRAMENGSDERRVEALDRALAGTEGALAKTREITQLLRPPVLDDLGLEEAARSYLAEFEQRTGIRVESRIHCDERLQAGPLGGQIYRILQEALTNAARHSNARRATVELDARDGELSLVVRDGGVGFDPGSSRRRRRSYGLLGMRERAEMLGGSFAVASAPGRGTEVRVRVPTTYDGSTTEDGA